MSAGASDGRDRDSRRKAFHLWTGVGLALVIAGLMAYLLREPAGQRQPVEQPGSHLPAQQQPPQAGSAIQLVEDRPATDREQLRRAPSGKLEPRRGRIAFPDGTVVEVAFKPMKRPAIAQPKVLADVYDELRRLAESGDASASWGLHRWLSQCNAAFVDEASLAHAIQRLNRERIVTSPVHPDMKLESVANIAIAEAVMRQSFEACRGITAEQRAEAPHWLEVSVASGELFALRAEAEEMRRSSPEHYLEQVNKLWREHGDVSSLSSLAVMHRRGIAGAEPDYRMVYAYQFAHFKFMEAAYSGSVYPSHRNMLRAMDDSLANTASYLTPAQTREATALGARLLAENRNCCTALQFGTVY